MPPDRRGFERGGPNDRIRDLALVAVEAEAPDARRTLATAPRTRTASTTSMTTARTAPRRPQTGTPPKPGPRRPRRARPQPSRSGHYDWHVTLSEKIVSVSQKE
jgi:hypothetical protein